MSKSRTIPCCLAFLIFPGLAVSDDALERRLRQEAPVQWASILQREDQVEGSFSVKVTYTGAKKPDSVKRHKFASNGELFKIETIQSGSKEEVTGINPDYLFSIYRGPGDSEYAISHLEPIAGGNPAKREDVEGWKKDSFNDIFASHYMLGSPLAEWLDRPGFRIKGVVPKPEGGRSLIRVDFDFVSDGKDRKFDIAEGFFVLDPDRRWTLSEYGAKKWWGRITAKLSYEDGSQDVPYPTRKIEILSGDGPGSTTKTLEIERLVHRPVPEREFTLTAYGLPEPSFVPKSSSTPYWFLALGGLLAAATVVLVKTRGRSGSSPAAP